MKYLILIPLILFFSSCHNTPSNTDKQNKSSVIVPKKSKSSQGDENWTRIKTGLSEKEYPSEIHCICFQGSKMIIGTDDGIFISDNNCENWILANKAGLKSENSSQCWVNAMANSGSNIIAATDDGEYLSSDNGKSWRAIHTGLPTLEPPDRASFTSFAVSDSNIFAASNYGVYLSSNNGVSWTEINNGLPQNPSVITANGSNVAALFSNGIYLSNDCGASWKFINTADLFNYATFNCDKIAVSGSNIIVGGNQELYISKNNGKTWKNISFQAIKYGLVGNFAIKGSDIFLCTMVGFGFESKDFGNSWVTIKTGIPDWEQATALIFNGSNLFVATKNSGVWKHSMN